MDQPLTDETKQIIDDETKQIIDDDLIIPEKPKLIRQNAMIRPQLLQIIQNKKRKQPAQEIKISIPCNTKKEIVTRMDSILNQLKPKWMFISIRLKDIIDIDHIIQTEIIDKKIDYKDKEYMFKFMEQKIQPMIGEGILNNLKKKTETNEKINELYMLFIEYMNVCIKQ